MGGWGGRGRRRTVAAASGRLATGNPVDPLICRNTVGWCRHPVTWEGQNEQCAQTSPRVIGSNPFLESSQARSKILEATEGSGNRLSCHGEHMIPTDTQPQPRTGSIHPLHLWGPEPSQVGHRLSCSVHVGSPRARRRVQAVLTPYLQTDRGHPRPHF